MRRLRMAGLAADELKADIARIRRSNATAAARYAAGIRATIMRAQESPAAGAWVLDADPPQRWRQMIYRNHRIIYRYDDQHVIVLRVFDGRRDPRELEETSERSG